MKYLRALSALTLAAGLAILALSGAGGVQDVFAAQEQSGVLAQALADEAQRIKLCVRDVLLDRFSAELSALDAPEAALEWLNAHLSEIEQAADAELRAQGAAYTARAVLGEQDFPDREYGGQAVPAGRYMALRLELGRAQGRNWWCVIYPTVCALSPDLTCEEADEVELHSVIWDWLSGVFGL